mmetsp:Transcript_44871/g.80687  ORF Transcript_44871/g.80687 Transcript_44871/m.80687 type:complete len:83 (+) Transcript_44871:307-555(+)
MHSEPESSWALRREHLRVLEVAELTRSVLFSLKHSTWSAYFPDFSFRLAAFNFCGQRDYCTAFIPGAGIARRACHVTVEMLR